MKSLRRRATITCFTWLRSNKPLCMVIPPNTEEPLTKTELKAKRLINVVNLHNALQDIHQDVAIRKTKAREVARARHNENPSVRTVDFSVGDFVLVAKLKSEVGSKFHVQWNGPEKSDFTKF